MASRRHADAPRADQLVESVESPFGKGSSHFLDVTRDIESPLLRKAAVKILKLRRQSGDNVVKPSLKIGSSGSVQSGPTSTKRVNQVIQLASLGSAHKPHHVARW